MFKRLKETYRNSNNLQLFFVICGAILFYALLNHLGPIRNAIGFLLRVLAPVITAAIIAFLLYPVVRFFENKIFRRAKRRKFIHGLCVVFTVIIICILLLLLIGFVIRQLTVSITHLLNNFDNYLKTFIQWFEAKLGDQANSLTVFGINLKELEQNGLGNFGKTIIDWSTEHLGGIIGGVGSIGSNLMNVLIIIMLAIYMLLDSEHIKIATGRTFRAFLEPSRYSRLEEICKRSSKIFLRYFGSNILDSIIIGVCCYVFMLILNLPYALIIAVVVGTTNFVPTFGPIVGAVIGAFLILVVNPMGAIWFIIYTLVTQFCDANLIKPKLFGDTTGLRPMWVLAAIIICGGLFGVTGMVLGVPLFAIIATISNEHIDRRIQRWGYVKEDVDQEM